MDRELVKRDNYRILRKEEYDYEANLEKVSFIVQERRRFLFWRYWGEVRSHGDPLKTLDWGFKTPEEAEKFIERVVSGNLVFAYKTLEVDRGTE